MTAKQIAEYNLIDTRMIGEPLRNEPETFKLYCFDPDEFAIFCDQLCKEQRELDYKKARKFIYCKTATALPLQWGIELRNEIENNKQPEV